MILQISSFSFKTYKTLQLVTWKPYRQPLVFDKRCRLPCTTHIDTTKKYHIKNNLRCNFEILAFEIRIYWIFLFRLYEILAYEKWTQCVTVRV